MKKYKLEIKPCHSDSVKSYYTKGFFDKEEFLEALKEYGEDIKLFSEPVNMFVKKVPVKGGSLFVELDENSVRGCFPVTVCWEDI